MFRHNRKIRVSKDGVLQIMDPDISDIPFLQSIDPDYKVRVAPLPGFNRPRFLLTRKKRTTLLKKDLPSVTKEALNEIYEAGLKEIVKDDSHDITDNHASLLDIKIELARRELIKCELCGRGCGVNRLEGEAGFCGLGADAYVGSTFIHISEEPPINPSLLIELYGCGMRCKFCQKGELWNVDEHTSEILDGRLWESLDTAEARSLSFIGGNPDESLYSILRFLNTAPDDFVLPTVWNCHGYGNIVAYKILEGVVDVYIPDLKYGDDKCAAKWSGVKRYVETAQRCIGEMIHQGVPVFVRMLILPGHSECCHIPSIHCLKEYRDSVSVNIMDQYCPELNITRLDGPMANRPEVKGVQRVKNEAKKAGLNLI